MNDKTKHVNRIPYETLADGTDVSSWRLPPIQTKRKVIFGAKREQREVRPGSEQEVVEDYHGRTKPKPLTAAELQALAEAAKKEGYEQGFSQGHEEGVSKGTKDGHKKGYEKAYKETKATLNNDIKRLNDVASTLLAPMQAQQEHLETIIVDMAINFSKAIIEQELQHSPDAIIAIVSRALAALPVGANNITVFLNQQDADLVETHLPQATRNWSVEFDETIDSGGCKVETADSLVDYTLQHRLDAFLSLIRSQTGAPNSEDFPPLTKHNATSVESIEEDKPQPHNRPKGSVAHPRDGADDV